MAINPAMLIRTALNYSKMLQQAEAQTMLLDEDRWSALISAELEPTADLFDILRTTSPEKGRNTGGVSGGDAGVSSRTGVYSPLEPTVGNVADDVRDASNDDDSTSSAATDPSSDGRLGDDTET